MNELATGLIFALALAGTQCSSGSLTCFHTDESSGNTTVVSGCEFCVKTASLDETALDKMPPEAMANASASLPVMWMRHSCMPPQNGSTICKGEAAGADSYSKEGQRIVMCYCCSDACNNGTVFCMLEMGAAASKVVASRQTRQTQLQADNATAADAGNTTPMVMTTAENIVSSGTSYNSSATTVPPVPSNSTDGLSMTTVVSMTTVASSGNVTAAPGNESQTTVEKAATTVTTVKAEAATTAAVVAATTPKPVKSETVFISGSAVTITLAIILTLTA